MAAARLVASVRRSNRLSSWPEDRQVGIDGRHFDVGIAAKDDQRRSIASRVVAMLADRVLDVFDHRLALSLRDAGRLVQQIDHGHPVAGPQELHLGQGQDDQQEDQRAEAQGDQSSPACPAR